MMEAGAVDGNSSDHIRGDTNGVRVLHNKVVLDISLQDQHIQGWCLLTCKAVQGAARVAMHAGQGLLVSGVRVDGADCHFSVSSGTDTPGCFGGTPGDALEDGEKHPFEQRHLWPKTPTETAGNFMIDHGVQEGQQFTVEVAFQVLQSSPSCFYAFTACNNNSNDDTACNNSNDHTASNSSNDNHNNNNGTATGAMACQQVTLTAVNDQARHWLPGIDRLDYRCKWDFELSMTLPAGQPHHEHAFVVASGALIQQIYDESRQRKVFSYKLDIAVPPCKIGLVAGLFEMHKVHGIPNAHIFTPHTGAPGTGAERVAPTVDFLTRSFGYLNWLLNTRYPWAGFYLVFAKEAPRMCTALPNLIILPTALLHDHSVIDQTWETRQWLCSALIEQYYFCKFLPTDRRDRWIVPALCRYLSFHQLRVFHGNNEYRLQLRADLQSVLLLDAHRRPLHHRHHHFELDPHHTVDNVCYQWMAKKGRLVLVMLEQCIGKQNIQKILMQMFIDANASEERAIDDLYSIGYLQRCIKRITGKEMRGFLEQWLTTAGVPKFEVSFTYNRKKSCVEFNISQSSPSHGTTPDTPDTPKRKPARFTGPLLIRIHETDTAYDHIVHIEDQQHHFELPFHTKVRKPRQTKAKPQSQVPGDDPQDDAAIGNTCGAVSPVSWVRVDPEIEWIADIQVHQPDVMWIEQLENDRDVIAQFDAIQALRLMPSEATCLALEKTIADFKAFHRVRSAGLVAMATCSTPLLNYVGARKLVDMFSRRFGLRDGVTGEVVPRPNNFENLSNYYLLVAIPEAVSLLRDQQGGCPEQALQLLLGLLRYNDNSMNAYSDYHYLVRVIGSLASAIATVPVSALVNACLEELDRYAYLERILPSHRNAVMVAVLRALGEMQCRGLCSFPLATYLEYLQHGHYVEVRMAAAEVVALLFPKEAIPVLVGCLFGDPSMAFRRAVGVLVAQCLRVPTQECASLLYEAVVKHAGLVGCEELWCLSERLFPMAATVDTPTITTQPPPTIQPIIIASPKKLLPPLHDEADWVTEISEGQPQQPVVTGLSASRRDTSTFSANVHVAGDTQPTVKALKLRLAIGPSQEAAKSGLQCKCEALLDALWEHPDSYPFRYPVDPSVPHYYDIILNPMDLTTLRHQPPPATPNHFLHTLRLIFDNCFQFNHPQSMIYAQAKELRKHAVKEAKRVFPELKGVVRDLIAADLPIQAGQGPPTPAPREHREERFEKEEQCRSLLLRLKLTPQAFWFLNPVDPVALNIPTYFDVIKEPMDLSTVAGKLDTGMYGGAGGFLRDLKLVFHNCYRFNNSGDPVCGDARLLEGMVVDQFGADYTAIDLSVSIQPVLKLKLAAPKQEPPTERDFEGPCANILATLMQDPQAGPFQRPVTGVPGYSKLIRHPMDLHTLGTKLHRHAYASASGFKADLDLIWGNCQKFNGAEAPITGMARHLAELADHLFNEFGL